MQKIKVGIVGLGNLGLAVKNIVQNHPNFELVATFSRRKLASCENYENIEKYIGKIDLLFLCVGSQNDLEAVSEKLIKNFNIVESYDNHSKLKAHISKMDLLAKQHNKIAICSMGWDPGLFSLMRGLFDALGYNSHTFWGKGLSQGHTQAIKNLPNVTDALQFTIPNKSTKRKVVRGKNVDSNLKHKRLCYVVCGKEHKQKIKQQIVSIPNYFLGQKTIVKFVTQNKLNHLKNFAHCGEILTAHKTLQFSLKLKSNPIFTATVLVAFAKNYINLKTQQLYGAHTIFDLPLSNILPKSKFEYL